MTQLLYMIQKYLTRNLSCDILALSTYHLPITRWQRRKSMKYKLNSRLDFFFKFFFVSSSRGWCWISKSSMNSSVRFFLVLMGVILLNYLKWERETSICCGTWYPTASNLLILHWSLIFQSVSTSTREEQSHMTCVMFNTSFF